MKRSLVSLSFAMLVATSAVATESASTEEGSKDRTPPTYPELGLAAPLQLAADGYRFNAGESTHDLVVQDVGSG
jgi:hypothetical protein